MNKAVSVLFVMLAASIAGAGQTTLSEVTNATGLSEQDIFTQVQSGLEALHFYEDDGRSCSLESFSYEGVQADQAGGALNQFVVETKAIAPVYECHGYRAYECETKFSKQGSAWVAVETTCED